MLDFFGFFLNAWAPGNRISRSIFCYFEVLGHYKNERQDWPGNFLENPPHLRVAFKSTKLNKHLLYAQFCGVSEMQFLYLWSQDT